MQSRLQECLGGSYLRELCANFTTFSNVPCHVRIPARPRVRVSQVQFVQRPQLSQLRRDPTPLVTKCALVAIIGFKGNSLLARLNRLWYDMMV